MKNQKQNILVFALFLVGAGVLGFCLGAYFGADYIKTEQAPIPTRIDFLGVLFGFVSTAFTVLGFCLAGYIYISWKQQQKKVNLLNLEQDLIDLLLDMTNIFRFYIYSTLVEKDEKLIIGQYLDLMRSIQAVRKSISKIYLYQLSHNGNVKLMLNDLSLDNKGDYLDNARTLTRFFASIGDKIEKAKLTTVSTTLNFSEPMSADEKTVIGVDNTKSTEPTMQMLISGINHYFDEAIKAINHN
ncbi:TPA: hypothetical protein ACVOY8_004422 [Vibrio diabolicus]